MYSVRGPHQTQQSSALDGPVATAFASKYLQGKRSDESQAKVNGGLSSDSAREWPSARLLSKGD